jgi:membrane-bound lytic murein transglycosylase B
MQLIGLFCLLWASIAQAQTPPSADWSYVEKRLSKAGLERDFIQNLKKTYETKHFSKVLKLNVLLYLKTYDYHAVQVSDHAVANVHSFLDKNKTIFEATEKDYGVSQSVIASLLWMETRHGQNYGVFHVPSAFIHLLQSERPSVVRYLQNSAHEFSEKKVTNKQKNQIARRTKKKAEWALGELKALQYMYKKSPASLNKLNGSFSGAFGMSQFLPSSYKHYARSLNKKSAPNLFTASDAIYSVGYYLKKHGWKKNNNKSHKKALLRYNNSSDYAEAILQIAKQAENAPIKRIPTAVQFVDLQ